MKLLLELLLCLAFVAFTAYETRSMLLKFIKPDASVLSFFGAIAFASVSWLWAYLAAVVLINGHFVENAVGPGVTVILFVLGFVSSCLSCYVLFYKDMPKGPTR